MEKNDDKENTRVTNDLDLQHITLADVIDIEFLQRFQDDFAKGMGLASVTVDLAGKPVTNPSSYTRFCTNYTHSTECGDKRCAESHRKGGEEAARMGKPVVYECHAGLIDFAAPIMIEGRLIGTILGGQVLTDIPDEAKYRKIASEIGVDGDSYIEAVKEIEPLSRQRIESAANVLFEVANSMSRIVYQQRKLQVAAAILNDVREQKVLLIQENNIRLEREIIERQAIQEVLEQQIAREQFVAALSTRLANCKMNRLGHYIKLALADIGNFFNISGSFLYLSCEKERGFRLKYHWCQKNTHWGNNKAFKRLDFDKYSWGIRQLKKTGQVHIDADSLSDEGMAEYQLMNAGQVKSIMIVPMLHDSHLIGFLGLASLGKKAIWQKEQAALMKVVGEIVLNALDRQRIFQELRKSETENRALVESIPDLMLRISSKGRILRVRNDDKNISRRLKRPQCLGRDFAEMVPEPIAELFSTVMAQALARGEVQKIEYDIVDKGVTRYHEARIVPTRDNAVLAVIRDITDQKKTAEALANTRDVIVNAQRMASLGVMAGSIAHEINQPLNSIKLSASGMLYLIQEGVILSTEDFQRELTRIVHETERINQVISKTCRIVREGVSYKGPMLVDRVLFRVLTLLKDQELFKDIKIEYQLVPHKAWIEGNETQIEQVLFHLLTNAAQALKKTGQQEKIIRISVQVAERAIVSVVDNGPGLEGTAVDKIFEPFFTTSKTAENMGLGLAIVQSIIYAYDGDIIAENNQGGGATFRVSFPLLEGYMGKEDKILEDYVSG